MVCSSDRQLTDAMGAKSARGCDYCIRKRARWYCAADDAFLCHSCDSSVHSANPLARRHERVQLNNNSSSHFGGRSAVVVQSSLAPTWHRGFTRKARTPRNSKPSSAAPKTTPLVKNPVMHLVPELCSDENSHDDNDGDQLLYRVPVFDIFMPDLCTTPTSNNINTLTHNHHLLSNDESPQKGDEGHKNWDINGNSNDNNIASEIELAEFAADVESLLGKGLDDESFDMEGLGFLDVNNDEEASRMECCSLFSNDKVKVEDGDDDDNQQVLMANNHHQDDEFDTLALKFDYDDSPNNNIEEEDDGDNYKEELSTVDKESGDYCGGSKKAILLNLDYEGVILAWPDQRSPWTTGERPELNSDDGWPNCMAACGTIYPYTVDHMGMTSGQGGAMADGGREARVSRYREKRRTRLFSKKIRYEVRKLNAEKRPRMKGRFVKTANFQAAALAFPLLNK